MKIIAMYLPQFHHVKENDEWWGEGYTDWVAARNAKPLFEDHYQPHIPLNNNYYDLLKKESMQWQAKLMKEYGIDGLCFFHYWFKDGQRILEKPAENLLKWKDIDMPFCFCWANESWARTWNAIPGTNVWTIDAAGNQNNDEESAFLLEQNYGEKKEWEEHFMYLLPFFKDKRYIRIEGKPVIQFYRAGQIYCLRDMILCWQQLAIKNGLPGIYIMAANLNGKLAPGVDAEFLYEPSKSLGNVAQRAEKGVSTYSYDEIWQYILKPETGRRKQYYCGVVSFDTTPRKGKYGTYFEGATPEKFGKYMMALMKKSENLGNDMVFVTAWNEWGEGNHLEPDEKYKYQWLEQIRNAKRHYKECDDITVECAPVCDSNKFEIYLNFLDRWMLIREEHIKVEDILCKRNLKTILIYGYGIIGKHLVSELSDSDVSVIGVIDKKNVLIHGLKTYTPDERLPKADAIIVTAFYFWEEIRTLLIENGVTTPVISFEEIMDEAFFLL